LNIHTYSPNASRKAVNVWIILLYFPYFSIFLFLYFYFYLRLPSTAQNVYNVYKHTCALRYIFCTVQ